MSSLNQLIDFKPESLKVLPKAWPVIAPDGMQYGAKFYTQVNGAGGSSRVFSFQCIAQSEARPANVPKGALPDAARMIPDSSYGVWESIQVKVDVMGQGILDVVDLIRRRVADQLFASKTVFFGAQESNFTTSDQVYAAIAPPFKLIESAGERTVSSTFLDFVNWGNTASNVHVSAPQVGKLAYVTDCTFRPRMPGEKLPLAPKVKTNGTPIPPRAPTVFRIAIDGDDGTGLPRYLTTVPLLEDGSFDGDSPQQMDPETGKPLMRLVSPGDINAGSRIEVAVDLECVSINGAKGRLHMPAVLVTIWRYDATKSGPFRARGGRFIADEDSADRVVSAEDTLAYFAVQAAMRRKAAEDAAAAEARANQRAVPVDFAPRAAYSVAPVEAVKSTPPPPAPPTRAPGAPTKPPKKQTKPGRIPPFIEQPPAPAAAVAGVKRTREVPIVPPAASAASKQGRRAPEVSAPLFDAPDENEQDDDAEEYDAVLAANQ